MLRLHPVVAHQYGWDEIAMFLVPIVLAVAGVRYAEHRAARKRRLLGDDDNQERALTPIDPAAASPEAERPSP